MNNFASKVLSASLGKTYVFFLGQAGFVFKSSQGTLLGIDMYLTNCVERVEGHIGFKRLTPIILSPSEIVFDYIVATHPHFDHFDMDAIPILMDNGHTKLIASKRCEQEVKRLLLSERNITYVAVSDKIIADDIHIECVFCDHGRATPDAIGLIIQIDGKKIYVAGDTCLRLDKAKELVSRGPFDVMIAPINGAYGNLNEKECVKLSKTLQPKVTIPCHYGTFASHGGNPGLFMDYMNEELPEQKYLLMAMGEELILK